MCGHPRRPVMVRRHARMAVLGIAVDLPSPRACAFCLGSGPYRRAARRLRAPVDLGCAQTDDLFGCLLAVGAVTSQRPQKWQDRGVSERVLFMHPPRDDFIATMSGTQRAAFDAHAAWLRRLLADGLLISAGSCLGQVNTGIAIFEAASESEAQRIVAGEPVSSGGYMRGDAVQVHRGGSGPDRHGRDRAQRGARGASFDHRRWHGAHRGAAGPGGGAGGRVPGKIRGEVSEADRAVIERNAATYVGLSRLHRRGDA